MWHVVTLDVTEQIETTWPAIAVWIETNVYFLAYPYVRMCGTAALHARQPDLRVRGGEQRSPLSRERAGRASLLFGLVRLVPLVLEGSVFKSLKEFREAPWGALVRGTGDV